MTTAPPGGVPAIQSGPSSQPATERGLRKESSSHLMEDAQEGAQGAKDHASSLRDHATKTMEDARQKVSETVDTVKERALGIADAQKSAGADQIDGVARAIHSAADSFKEQMPGAASYIHEAASGVEKFSSSVRNRSVDELVSSLTTFARTQPTAFFGASVLAGFALSRFLKSSAERGEGGHTHAGVGMPAASGASSSMRQPSPRDGASSGADGSGLGAVSDRKSSQYGRL